MYRQGLGDCFLVTLILDDDSHFNILIDCGVILGTKDPSTIMEKVANNIKTEVGDSIDVVVITHEHWDHLSGFTQARNIFDTIQFKEVWMAWTEDPTNKIATSLRETREAKKKALQASLTGLQAELNNNQFLTAKQKTAKQLYLQSVEEVVSFNGGPGVNGISSTAEALNYVKTKGASNLYFCTPGTEPFSLHGIEGIRFYVLGPPEDVKLLKKDLSKKEVYPVEFNTDFGKSFINAITPGITKGEKYLPFDQYTGIKYEDAKKDTRFSFYFEKELWRKIDSDWMEFTGQLALSLDNDTNNTSLVLAIELIDKEKFILFPGDAQVGNWLSWQNYSWEKINAKGEKKQLDIKDIFAKTILYKVSHHGSHNATLSDKGLELMTDPQLTAIIPVNKEMARKKNWNMPFPSLFDKLQEKTLGKVLTSDEDFDKTAQKPSSITQGQWSDFINAVTPDPSPLKLYVDFTVEC